MPNTPQMSRLRKNPEFPDDNSLTFARTEKKKAIWGFVDTAEEQERDRRIAFDREILLEERRQSIFNRAYTTLLEEQERERRIEELLELKKGIEKTEKTKEIAKEGVTEKKEPVLLLEEEEDINTREKELSELDRAYTIVMEEQERSRRIAEEGYVKEVEAERRKDNQAWAVIAEEEERLRRISIDEYLDQVEEEYRADDKAYTKIAEEQERSRRIALGAPSEDILQKIKSIAHSVANAALTKGEKKPARFRRGQRGLRKSEGEVQRPRTYWQAKKPSPPLETKSYIPAPPPPPPVTQPKESRLFKKKAPVSEGGTTKQLETLLQHKQVYDERKQMVDKMSTELFDKIARKVKAER